MAWDSTICWDATAVNFDPNPDVSGIGVLIGFLATAWATFLVLLVHYVVVSEDSSSNPLDMPLRNLLRRIFRCKPTKRWDKPLRTVVLAMSDQQLVTGIAILVSGYSQLDRGISLYHWQIITTLTWFSTTTHLATLPSLQQYFQQHKYVFYLRVLLMFSLAIMLVFALLPTGNTAFNDQQMSYAISGTGLLQPVRCYLDLPRFGFDIKIGGVYTVLSEILLIGALLVRLVRMFPGSRSASIRILCVGRDAWRNNIAFMGHRHRHKLHRSISSLILHQILISGMAWLSLFYVLYDLACSSLFEILWLFFSLAWATIRLFTLRASTQDASLAQEEDYWGFGQLVPILLLILPVLLICETWSEATRKDDDETVQLSRQQTSLPLNCTLEGEPQVRTPICPQIAPPTSQSSNSGDSSLLHEPHSWVAALCSIDFRKQSWYTETLYFTTSYLIALMPFVLRQASNSNITHNPTPLVITTVVMLSLVMSSLTSVVTCGIWTNLYPPGADHGFTFIGFMTFRDKKHRITRYIYFVCFAIGVGVSLWIFF